MSNQPRIVVRMLVVSLLVLAACEGGAGDAPDSATGLSVVTDSAGVAIVSGPGTDTPLLWTLRERFRLGGADSGAGSFTRLHPQLAGTDSLGRLFVLDPQQHRVELFGADGTPLRFVGGKGGGPGEFDMAASLQVLPSGEMAVLDYSKQAIVRWSASGETLNEYPLLDFFPTGPLQLRGDTLLYRHDSISGDVNIQEIRIRTPLATRTLARSTSTVSGMVNFGCIGLNLAPMFASELVMAGDAERTVISAQVPYVIDVFESGQLRRSIRRALPIETPDITHATRRHPEGMKVRFPNGECVVPVADLVAKQGLATQLPQAESFVVDPTGYLWVQRFGVGDEPRQLDVFDRDGQYLGTLEDRRLPIGFGPADQVYFAEADEDTGLDYVVAYTITRSVP